MTTDLPTMDDLLKIFRATYCQKGFTAEPAIAAVIDRLGAWHLVAPQSRPIPDGWSNEPPPAGEMVRVSYGTGMYEQGCFGGSRPWAEFIAWYPAAIWHPLPTDPRVDP